MKKLILLIPVSIFIFSCEETKPAKTEKVKIEEEIIDPDVINDTVLLMELFPEGGLEEAEGNYEEDSRNIRLYSEWYDYLLENYDTISVSNKVIGESAYGGLDICLFEQRFEQGIWFEYSGCGEGGANQSLVFPGFTKKELYEIINSEFFTEDNTWNEDSTSYEADGAGCYYSIEERNDSLFVSTYCGC